MSAHISIETGISAGTTYWIDRPVLRVGSDPQCDICLPSTDLAPHSLTVEYRDGRYRVYNRCPSAISLGGISIPAGGAGELVPDRTISLPGELKLVLKVDGDPRPSPRPAERDFDSELNSIADNSKADSEIESQSVKKSSKTLVQSAVIGFCVLGGAAFLSMGGGDAPVASKQIPSFDELVAESLSRGDSARDRLQRLQYAQAALVRGHSRLARERFKSFRSQLVRHAELLPESEREDIARFLSYVEYRISQF